MLDWTTLNIQSIVEYQFGKNIKGVVNNILIFMVIWGSGYPSTLSLWRPEFDSRYHRNMKQLFEAPQIELIQLDEEDIITTSGNHNGWNKNPHNPHYTGSFDDDDDDY